MKNSQVLELHEKIKFYSSNLKDLKGAKFSYALIKNTSILEKEAEVILKAGESPAEYAKYDEERNDLCQKFAKKDESGNVLKKNVQENGTFEYDIDLTDSKWIAEFNLLQEKYKSVLEENRKIKEDWFKFLAEDSNVEFHKISLDVIPDTISVELMALLEPFLQD